MDKIADSYYTISKPSTGDYREKGSKFLAYAYAVSTVAEVETALQQVRAPHPKARHFCYAYQLGIDGEQHRANDDGEPSGTAGRPILGQLHSHQVSDCIVIVVRYWGGTKLGASGLINAYRTAASLALSAAIKKEVILGASFQLDFTYAEMGHVLNVLKSLDIDIIEKSFESTPSVTIRIRASEVDAQLVQLKADLLGFSTDQIIEETEIPFCTISLIKD